MNVLCANVVRIVAAAADPNILENALKTGRKLIVASEYETYVVLLNVSLRLTVCVMQCEPQVD